MVYLYRALSKDGKQAAIGQIEADDPEIAARRVYQRYNGSIAIAVWEAGAKVWFYNPKQDRVVQ